MSRSVFIVAAKRTPFGSFGGSLKGISATDLGVVATKAAIAQCGISPENVNQVYFGNVIQSGTDAAYLARHIGLKSGCSISTPALTINRLCGSGFESVIQGYKNIMLADDYDDCSIAVCGGTENMSAAPMVMDGNMARWGVPLGKGMKMNDSLWDGLTDQYAGTPMGITAENLAVKYNITREECDSYAIRSQTNWKNANDNNIFDSEMAPVTVPGKKKGTTITVDTDEHPKPETTLEKISKLPAVFKKDGGVVTAANASGICDGAGSVILASEEAVKRYNLTPLARIVSYGITGCEPTIMGIGPVEAIKKAISKTDYNLHNDIDRIEINEAFAAQFLACAKDLELDMTKCNINGGAISIGHPLGASGSRITSHLVNDNKTTRLSIGAACIGGGQGIAILFERC